MDDLRHCVRLVAVPPEVPDQPARRTAAVMVSALGVPYFSISGGHGLRLRGGPDPALDPVSFVGYAVRTEPLECLALFMLRPASPPGRCSIGSDLRAAAALVEGMTPGLFDARSEHLHGAGTPDAPPSIGRCSGHSPSYWRPQRSTAESF